MCCWQTIDAREVLRDRWAQPQWGKRGPMVFRRIEPHARKRIELPRRLAEPYARLRLRAIFGEHQQVSGALRVSEHQRAIGEYQRTSGS